MRRIVFIIAAFVATFAANVQFASARTYDHGKTVWFSDLAIGDGDEVRGNLNVVFGNVTCSDGAEIDGDVHTFFGSFAQLDGCQVDGRVVDASGDAFVPWLGPLGNDDVFAQNRSFLRKLAWDVLVLFAFLLFPMRVRVALDRVERQPGLSGVVGALGAIAILPIAVFLAFSILGIPLIPIEIALLFAGLCIGNAAVALLIGRRLYELLRPHTTPTPLAALGLGLVVVTGAETLPTIGWAVIALVFLVGLGSAILAFMRETSFRSFGGGPPGASTIGASPMNGGGRL